MGYIQSIKLFIIDLENLYHEASGYYYIEDYNQGSIGFFYSELKLSPLQFDLYD